MEFYRESDNLASLQSKNQVNSLAKVQLCVINIRQNLRRNFVGNSWVQKNRSGEDEDRHKELLMMICNTLMCSVTKKNLYR